MLHEFAREIHFGYWNNNLPSDAGSSHTLGDCLTRGLDLM